MDWARGLTGGAGGYWSLDNHFQRSEPTPLELGRSQTFLPNYRAVAGAKFFLFVSTGANFIFDYLDGLVFRLKLQISERVRGARDETLGSPNDGDAIRRKMWITGDEHHSFASRLSDQEPVKWIPMMQRHPQELVKMSCVDRLHLKSEGHQSSGKQFFVRDG